MYGGAENQRLKPDAEPHMAATKPGWWEKSWWRALEEKSIKSTD